MQEEVEVIDTEKATKSVEVLNSMTNKEVGYAFENMNVDGILNINCIIAHSLNAIMNNAKKEFEKRKH